eukprot:841030-Pelagomonas_calceolata.AAC.1
MKRKVRRQKKISLHEFLETHWLKRVSPPPPQGRTSPPPQSREKEGLWGSGRLFHNLDVRSTFIFNCEPHGTTRLCLAHLKKCAWKKKKLHRQ